MTDRSIVQLLVVGGEPPSDGAQFADRWGGVGAAVGRRPDSLGDVASDRGVSQVDHHAISVEDSPTGLVAVADVPPSVARLGGFPIESAC